MISKLILSVCEKIRIISPINFDENKINELKKYISEYEIYQKHLEDNKIFLKRRKDFIINLKNNKDNTDNIQWFANNMCYIDMSCIISWENNTTFIKKYLNEIGVEIDKTKYNNYIKSKSIIDQYEKKPYFSNFTKHNLSIFYLLLLLLLFIFVSFYLICSDHFFSLVFEVLLFAIFMSVFIYIEDCKICKDFDILEEIENLEADVTKIENVNNVNLNTQMMLNSEELIFS